MDTCAEQRRHLSDEFKQFRKVFTALGDETRQQIFITLLENETVGMRVPEITRQTHLSRPAVSHHLQILKDAGLINMHRTGTKHYYYVDADNGCWGGLKDLVDHVDAVVVFAAEAGYPKLSGDEAG
ncbi:MAG: metalloregulator ArsR/SmtB family transcription factor [Anaerolineaceae bacterium]